MLNSQNTQDNRLQQSEKEVREFIVAWGEAWSPRDKAPEFDRQRIEPFYLQNE